MRRQDRALGPDDARQLLATAEYGVLSLASPSGVPYGIPLNFAFVPDAIYIHGAPDGRKIELLTANRQVSFCVVGHTEVLPAKFSTRYESVIATGTAEELFADEKKAGLLLLVKKYSPAFLAEGLVYIDQAATRTKVFRINLDSITGKARR